MDELVKMVAEKTGLSEDMARKAVEAVLEFLTERLPEPIAGQVTRALQGGGDDQSGLGGLLQKGLGGLLG
ncbi:MAG: DUF2267 domain-containing protein [Chloroflexi bacterium]|nr:DUF2267 domain-containing protein [Chloroflexota bacterium]